jgi:hypothetical protein
MTEVALQPAILSPPAPPSPSQDAGLVPDLSALGLDSLPSPNSPYGEWDPDSLLPEVAMKMLAKCVEALVRLTGEIPPTPPISRMPFKQIKPEFKDTGFSKYSFRSAHRRTMSRPGTPMSSHDIKKPEFSSMNVGSPEAEEDEPTAGDIHAETAHETRIQQMTIARKFFCKTPPNVSVEQYLKRLHRFCPMSTAVYLAAGSYIQRLCVEDKLVPATRRTVHRLVLGSLRVAMKALEDLRYSQERFSVVGGVKQEELSVLEISLCYLLNFELQVTHDSLLRRMTGLIQAAGIAHANDNMELRLPSRSGPG